jgi:hypothetical protein
VRTLLVFVVPDKEFKIDIPDEAKVTFGPWSPPSAKGYTHNPIGTLRVYANSKTGADCLLVESGVTGFRDTAAIHYQEKVLREEGSTVWKSDEFGYSREERASGFRHWSRAPELPASDEDDEEGRQF